MLLVRFVSAPIVRQAQNNVVFGTRSIGENKKVDIGKKK